MQDLAAYPIMPTRVAGIEMDWPAALINVYQQPNVRISGKGTIDGNGKIWWDKYWKMRREEYEPKGLRWAVDYDCQRPRLIQIYKSSDVRLEGLTLKRPGFWTVHICYSQQVTVDGVTIRNNTEARGPSTDGIDIDSSSGVTVQHCDIECNDDAICLKAGRDADGLRVNRPSRRSPSATTPSAPAPRASPSAAKPPAASATWKSPASTCSAASPPASCSNPPAPAAAP